MVKGEKCELLSASVLLGAVSSLGKSWSGLSENVSDHEIVLNSTGLNSDQSKGETLVVNFIGHANGSDTPDVCVFIEELGNDDCNDSVIPVMALPSSDIKDYADALGKSILFFAAQRSGKLPEDNPVPWRGDSALQDCVVGGWYDGGDHVKFGFPMASATTLLLWGLYQFKDGYEYAGQLDPMYDAVRWPLDYFLRAWNPFSQELVAQVGDATADHAYWGRPEDMTMSRPCKKVGPNAPGSDIAGQTAAALALGAIVFQDKGDTEYAATLLDAAENMYTFASTNLGLYTDTITDAVPFYRSTGYQDELCLAAAWLYRVTQRPEYLTAAASYLDDTWAWALDWNDKKVLCQIVLYEETRSDQYEQEVEAFLQGWLPGGHVTYTPCGLAWFSQHGSNRYAANTAFLSLLAAEAGINSPAYRVWGVKQINYILGDNSACFSYQIGHGQSYPRSPRHRAASCPDVPTPCTAASLTSREPNPQVLVGALVGGPSSDDSFTDDRQDADHNGVALVYNAGFQSAVAGILHLQVTGLLPNVTSTCPCQS